MKACEADPDRWSDAEQDDPAARELCQQCGARPACVDTALMLKASHSGGPSGIWGGVFLPPPWRQDGRKRQNAYRHLEGMQQHFRMEEATCRA